jgi:hypothetical protein
MEIIAMRGLSRFVLISDLTRDNKMDWICGTFGREQECIAGFGGET